MRLRNRVLWWLAPIVVLVCFATLGSADPPARIGRLNYLSGSVSFRPGDLDDWTPAAINLPLKTGDHLWTDMNSFVELHVGSTALRLAPQTDFAFLNLDDQITQIRLTQGALNVRLRQFADNEAFEIDTPNSTTTLLRPGSYRIDVDGEGNTFVTNRLGDSEVTAAGTAFTVHPNERAVITGTDSPTYEMVAAVSEDDWERWCTGRDRHEDQAASVRYVSREMVGYEDLDQFGAWRTVPEYGAVWVPTVVPVGWAPYRFGHWMWIEPWGWTWVDDMAWGFAPFHYGRWAYVQGTWMWVPGRLVARPVYAPALVAFVGGSSWHVSVSIGTGVAWFPLGPREVYVPAYHVSDTYVRNVNVTHVNVTTVNITNVNVVNTTYINRNVPGAVTAVSRDTFARAQPISKAAVVVPREAVAAAPVSGMTANIAPRQESLTGRSGAPAVARPPAEALNRAVVARRTPPPPQIPFAARQSALAANPGQPLDSAKLAALRQNVPAAQPLVRPAVPITARPDAVSNAQLPTGQHSVAKAPVPNQPSSPPATAPRTFENDRPARGAAEVQPSVVQSVPRVEPQQRSVPSVTPAPNSERNDRQGNAAVPRPARPETKPVPAPRALPVGVAQQQKESPHPAPKVEDQRGPRPKTPQESEKKPQANPRGSDKEKPKDEK